MVTHRRGPWSQHEDNWLISLVHRNGAHNWVRISGEIGTRSPKQCRERYHQNLKPSLNHDPITPEEGEMIERLVTEMGKRWAEIARRLNGRSDNAVKNWWNGGQNRRKRNPERSDEHLQQSHPYHYPPAVHHNAEPVQHHPQVLPSIRDYPDQSSYYGQSRRPSLNTSLHSPSTIKLPQPQGYEPYPGSRPQPLELSSFTQYPRARAGETPLPSPGHSIASFDAPSLVTDSGSDTRSPRGAPSPLEHSLPPMIGSRDERRNSSTRYLPHSGFAGEDDEPSTAYDPYKRRASVQLPPLHRAEPAPVAQAFREPNYKPEARFEKPQLLTQPVQHQQIPGQQPLPRYENLSLPTVQTNVQPTTSPSSRQLPSPFARPAPVGDSKSAPTSPRHNTPRDERMKLDHIL